MATTTLHIAHFNDAYKVTDHDYSFVPKVKETINVAKFATVLEEIRSNWPGRKDDDSKKDGLTVFSGDLFSPSVESSILKGKHMPKIVNKLGIDVACIGNHEFDNGLPNLMKLLPMTEFPWLLSNVIDKNTGKVPETMHEFHVVESAGVRVGFIGLVEKDWTTKMSAWPSHFEHCDMATVGKQLSAKLRDPDGPHRCDLVIAVTHSRISNDIQLAYDLLAVSSSTATQDISLKQGVDLILGGHDHVYWVSKGINEWEGYDLKEVQPDAASDKGDVLIVKSGTDFQDLSDITLTLKDAPAGHIRRKVIQEIKGKRFRVTSNTLAHRGVEEVVKSETREVEAKKKVPICITEVQLDTRATTIRKSESLVGNWIADFIRPSSNVALANLGHGHADGAIVLSGSLRGDGVMGPGILTMGHILEILSFDEPTAVLELDGGAFWDIIEHGLSAYPSDEGQFPCISGFRVEWDSTRDENDRVVGIWLTKESGRIGEGGNPIMVDKERVLRTSERTYLIVVGEYITTGGDGYKMVKEQKQIISAEGGQTMPTIVRLGLEGLRYLAQQVSSSPATRSELQSTTRSTIAQVEDKLKSLVPEEPPVSQARGGGVANSAGSRSSSIPSSDGKPIDPVKYLSSQQDFIAAALLVAVNESIDWPDPYVRERAPFGREFFEISGGAMRGDFSTARGASITDNPTPSPGEFIPPLPKIHPIIDGRLKNIAPPKAKD